MYNDDFCDFPDGRDEPLTSACSHVKAAVQFPCGDLEAGSTVAFIPTSRVRDGTSRLFFYICCHILSPTTMDGINFIKMQDAVCMHG